MKNNNYMVSEVFEKNWKDYVVSDDNDIFVLCFLYEFIKLSIVKSETPGVVRFRKVKDYKLWEELQIMIEDELPFGAESEYETAEMDAEQFEQEEIAVLDEESLYLSWFDYRLGNIADKMPYLTMSDLDKPSVETPRDGNFIIKRVIENKELVTARVKFNETVSELIEKIEYELGRNQKAGYECNVILEKILSSLNLLNRQEVTSRFTDERSRSILYKDMSELLYTREMFLAVSVHVAEMIGLGCNCDSFFPIYEYISLKQAYFDEIRPDIKGNKFDEGNVRSFKTFIHSVTRNNYFITPDMIKELDRKNRMETDKLIRKKESADAASDASIESINKTIRYREEIKEVYYNESFRENGYVTHPLSSYIRDFSYPLEEVISRTLSNPATYILWSDITELHKSISRYFSMVEDLNYVSEGQDSGKIKACKKCGKLYFKSAKVRNSKYCSSCEEGKKTTYENYIMWQCEINDYKLSLRLYPQTSADSISCAVQARNEDIKNFADKPYAYYLKKLNHYRGNFSKNMRGIEKKYKAVKYSEKNDIWSLVENLMVNVKKAVLLYSEEKDEQKLFVLCKQINREINAKMLPWLEENNIKLKTVLDDVQKYLINAYLYKKSEISLPDVNKGSKSESVSEIIKKKTEEIARIYSERMYSILYFQDIEKEYENKLSGVLCVEHEFYISPAGIKEICSEAAEQESMRSLVEAYNILCAISLLDDNKINMLVSDCKDKHAKRIKEIRKSLNVQYLVDEKDMFNYLKNSEIVTNIKFDNKIILPKKKDCDVIWFKNIF